MIDKNIKLIEEKIVRIYLLYMFLYTPQYKKDIS
jgi:hypothetical protein